MFKSRENLIWSFYIILLKFDLLNWMFSVQDHVFVWRLLSDRLCPRDQCLNLAPSWLNWIYSGVYRVLQQKVFLISLSLMVTDKKWWDDSSCVRLCVKLSINWLPELSSCCGPVYWRNCRGQLVNYPWFFIVMLCGWHHRVVANRIKFLLFYRG